MTFRSEDVPDVKAFTLGEIAAIEQPAHVVKGLFREGDLGMVYGPPGCGKSVVLPHLAVCVAAGVPFFGRRVRQGAALYVGGEDALGIALRLKAAALPHGEVPGLLLVAHHGLNLLLSAHQHALGRLLLDHEPVLVIVDTLASVMPGLDENDAAAMGAAVAALRGISLACGSAVVVAHHSPKNGDTPRGHGILNGALDAAVRVEGEGREPRRALFTKNRSGPSGEGFGFSITAHDFGRDEDGDAVTAPIVDVNAAPVAVGRRRPLPPQAQRALDILHDAISRQGQAPPAGANAPQGVLAVREEVWRQAVYAGTVSDGETQDARRKAFKRSADTLAAAKRIGIHGGWVWSAKP